MKKHSFILLSAILLFSACSKSGPSTPSTPTITLNVKEKQLLGHWQLKKIVDSSGMTGALTVKYETKYQTTDFIELKDRKEWAKTLEEKIKDARIGGAGAALAGINTPTNGVVQDFVGWYYDEGISKLVLMSIPYDVISVSGSELILWRFTISGSYYTSTTSTYTK